MTNFFQNIQLTQRVKSATGQIARTGARITALQLLAIADYSASLCLVLRPKEVPVVRTPIRTL
jgi:hypothetical protein